MQQSQVVHPARPFEPDDGALLFRRPFQGKHQTPFSAVFRGIGHIEPDSAQRKFSRRKTPQIVLGALIVPAAFPVIRVIVGESHVRNLIERNRFRDTDFRRESRDKKTYSGNQHARHFHVIQEITHLHSPFHRAIS